jgi:hypothetical protein
VTKRARQPAEQPEQAFHEFGFPAHREWSDNGFERKQGIRDDLPLMVPARIALRTPRAVAKLEEG